MTIPARSDSFVSRKIGEDTILVPVRAGVANLEADLHDERRRAARSGIAIDGKTTLGDLARAIADEFDGLAGGRGARRRGVRRSCCSDKGLVVERGRMSVVDLGYGAFSAALHSQARARRAAHQRHDRGHAPLSAQLRALLQQPARGRRRGAPRASSTRTSSAASSTRWPTRAGSGCSSRAARSSRARTSSRSTRTPSSAASSSRCSRTARRSRRPSPTTSSSGGRSPSRSRCTAARARPTSASRASRARTTAACAASSCSRSAACRSSSRPWPSRSTGTRSATCSASRRELGVEFKFDGMINARIDCSHSPLEMRLTPAEMVELDLEDPARAEEWAALVRGHSRLDVDAGRDARAGLSLRRRRQRVRDRSRGQDEHLRAVAARTCSTCARAASSEGWDDFLAKVRAKKTHAPHEVQRLPHPRAVLDLRRHGGARARRRRDARRVLLRGGAPARARARVSRRPRTASARSARAAAEHAHLLRRAGRSQARRAGAAPPTCLARR